MAKAMKEIGVQESGLQRRQEYNTTHSAADSLALTFHKELIQS